MEKEMNATEYKKYHESFMQNNHGSTAVHTFFCIFFTVQCSLLCAITKHKNKRLRYLYEYFVLVFPLTLAHTVLSKHIYILNLLTFGVIMYNLLCEITIINVTTTFNLPNHFPNNFVLSISILRGLTYLITVCCILAVDFKSFPRILAKTERFGFSLMDTGVGLFVIMSGLVHKDLKTVSTWHIIKSNTKFVTVLLTLGINRFIFVKQLDYQEHVTEYGVHWNFFFTLAVCKVLSSILLSLTKKALILSILVITIHQYILSLGVQDWVFSDQPRTDLVSGNREGLSSSLGYVALYLFAVHVKKVLTKMHVYRLQICLRLLVGSVIFWILLFCFNEQSPISRVLANFMYFTYLAATLMTILTVMYVFEVLYTAKNTGFEVPLILSAINRNGLLYFLFANILTGVVNLSMRTLFVPPHLTVFILNFYLLSSLALVVVLQNKGIKT